MTDAITLNVEQRHRAIMQSFYDAIFGGDWASVEQCVSPKLIIYEADGLPYHGEHRGLDGLQALFGRLIGYWEDLKIEPYGITTGDGYAVGILQFSGTSKATGIKVSMPIAEIAKFENDRIASITPVYWDTKILSEAIGD